MPIEYPKVRGTYDAEMGIKVNRVSFDTGTQMTPITDRQAEQPVIALLVIKVHTGWTIMHDGAKTGARGPACIPRGV